MDKQSVIKIGSLTHSIDYNGEGFWKANSTNLGKINPVIAFHFWIY